VGGQGESAIDDGPRKPGPVLPSAGAQLAHVGTEGQRIGKNFVELKRTSTIGARARGKVAPTSPYVGRIAGRGGEGGHVRAGLIFTVNYDGPAVKQARDQIGDRAVHSGTKTSLLPPVTDRRGAPYIRSRLQRSPKEVPPGALDVDALRVVKGTGHGRRGGKGKAKTRNAPPLLSLGRHLGGKATLVWNRGYVGDNRSEVGIIVRGLESETRK